MFKHAIHFFLSRSLFIPLFCLIDSLEQQQQQQQKQTKFFETFCKVPVSYI